MALTGGEQPGNCADKKLVDCGLGTISRPKNDTIASTVHHSRNDVITISFGDKVVTAYSRIREFNLFTILENMRDWDVVVKSMLYVTANNIDGYYDCYDLDVRNSSTIAENYTTIDTVILLNDPRYEMWVYKTVTESLSFVQESAELAYFRETVGNTNYPLIRMPARNKHVITTWHLYVKTTVGDVVISLDELLHTWEREEPVQAELNIVWPLPPSQATCYDTTLVFYDYNEFPGDAGWVLGRVVDDGGKDFFYPDWCRAMGIDNTIDIALKNQRLASINQLANARTYGGTLPTESSTHTVNVNKKIIKPVMPQCDCKIDKFGNVMVSLLCDDGASVNKIYIPERKKTNEDGTVTITPAKNFDLSSVTKIAPVPAATIYYPIGLM